MQFVIATGRHFCDVAGIRDILGIKPYLITSNGARIHAPDNTVIHADDLPPAIVQRLVQPGDCRRARSRDRQPVRRSGVADRPRRCPSLLKFHQDSGFTYEVAELLAHDGVDIAKVSLYRRPGGSRAVAANLAREFGDALYVTYSLPDCLEVMTSNVSKDARCSSCSSAWASMPRTAWLSATT